nr:DNA polymerase iota-like [Nothobranchius furzeri]XP_054586200.1 DNA polymerase iota-like [Nothobranchius furzeri]
MSVSLKPLGLQSEDSRQPTSGSVGRAASARSPTASDKSSALKTEEAVVQLVLMAMKLFQNMVDSSADFHLTLLDVCFSNLQTRGAAVSAITSFFTQNTSPRKPQHLPSQNQVRKNPTPADSVLQSNSLKRRHHQLQQMSVNM